MAIEDARRDLEETLGQERDSLAALAQAREVGRALAAEKECLAVALRSIDDGVIAADIDGRVTLMNRAAEALTGWRQEEAIGQPVGEVFRPIDPATREKSDNTTGMQTADPMAATGRNALIVRRDGTELPVQEIAAPLYDAEGRRTGIVRAFRDTSHSIRIQEERARAIKLESLGLLAGGIAHDFNNILTAILGNVSLARAHAEGNPRIAIALDEAEQACARARQLTKQLLTFSKGGTPVKKPLQLERVVQESVKQLALSGSPVELTSTIDPNLWVVNADEGQLLQVFSNIIVNAQQAMPEGGRIVISGENISEPEDRWEFGLRVSRGPYVSISVADEGVGVPEDVLGRIFEPYFSTKPTGSGLGLATAQSIVKNHGGYIEVQSEPGHGSTLRVCLPAALTQKVDEALELLARERRGAGRVLVLDDEEAMRTLSAQLLRLLGYESETVGTCEEAIARYTRARDESRPFDIVMLDLTIPGGSGGEQVVRVLTDIDPGVRAIVVSGCASDTLLTRYREHGFKAVIAKPFTLSELKTALDQMSQESA